MWQAIVEEPKQIKKRAWLYRFSWNQMQDHDVPGAARRGHHDSHVAWMINPLQESQN
jgi:hypothetical protein